MLARRKSVVLTPTALVLFAALGLAVAGHAQSTAPSQGVPVTTVPVSRQDVPVLARAIGTVQPFQSVLIRARVDGTLDQILFTEGQHVRPGDLLAQLDPRPYQAILDQALAKRAADEAMLSNARGDLVRYTDLASSQIASRQRLDLQKTNVMQAEAGVHGDDAAIAAAQLNLGFTRITAPIEGRVGLRLVDPGNFIRVADNNSTGIVTIAQIQPIALIFTMPQDALPSIQAAMRRGKLPVLAYSGDDHTLLSQGELMTIDSSIDVSTGTIKLKAAFGNIDEALWPGQFINVRMRLDVRKDASTIPSSAVQRGPNGLFVYTVKPDNTAGLQAVDVAQDDGKVAVITGGLDGTETVIVSGQSRLSGGTRVAATAAKPAS